MLYIHACFHVGVLSDPTLAPSNLLCQVGACDVGQMKNIAVGVETFSTVGAGPGQSRAVLKHPLKSVLSCRLN